MESKNAHHDFAHEEALLYHQYPTPGKYTIKTVKPMNTQKDLSLAYTPGVAVPCLEIQKDKENAYLYTNKGNMVAVITNGTAVLGLGDIGALAGKPVMEGKAVLFNKFAGVESVDLSIDTKNPDEFINCVKLLSCTFGGINLEDIKAPECFYIEEKLKEVCDIPIFHDDQHGTAIVCLAGLINAVHLTGRKIEETKVVLNGAGAAGIACLRLMNAYGVKHDNIIACDTQGVIYKGRTAGMNKWKEEFANATTTARTLEEALKGADVFIGVSVANALKPEYLVSMAPHPIIFAMANPVPEIMPPEAKKVRPDAIIATGRSDFPNQINNVMCFPFLFRGTLDTRTRVINEPMKLAAAKALAMLAREPVPKEVQRAYAGTEFSFGPDYIMPTPFDPRLIDVVPRAVA
jgi:malate dehydrogenase (oxaloacetate-decarboxylating)(NADP+)